MASESEQVLDIESLDEWMAIDQAFLSDLRRKMRKRPRSTGGAGYVASNKNPNPTKPTPPRRKTAGTGPALIERMKYNKENTPTLRKKAPRRRPNISIGLLIVRPDPARSSAAGSGG
jgi:hypothetical protein